MTFLERIYDLFFDWREASLLRRARRKTAGKLRSLRRHYPHAAVTEAWHRAAVIHEACLQMATMPDESWLSAEDLNAAKLVRLPRRDIELTQICLGLRTDLFGSDLMVQAKQEVKIRNRRAMAEVNASWNH